jgi:hypothetical protein
VAEIEREKPGAADDEYATSILVPDGPVAIALYAGWLCVSLAIGVALLDSGPLGIARLLFAVGVTVILACLPLAWAKGWTD